MSSAHPSSVSESSGDPCASPLVSVVIPARNAAATIAAQLEALTRQRTDRAFEVLVADNGSGDGTGAVAAAFCDRLPGLRVVDASRRAGSNVARNAGFAAARGELVLMCDADDVVHEDWLERMAAALEGADAVGGRLDRELLNPDLLALWPTYSGHAGITEHLDYLPRPIGANAGVRRSVWCALDGFDEEYVRGGTETEFFWRLQLAGYRLVDVEDAIVFYRMRGTRQAMVRQMYIWGRQAPMLYRDFRDRGMRWRPGTTLRAYRHAVATLFRSLPRGGYLSFQRQAAYLGGRVVGSVVYRVLYV